MQGKRLTGPTVLSEGSVFGMSRHKFKVTRIGDGPGLSGDEEDALFQDDLAPPEIAPPMSRSGPSAQRPPLPQDDFPPLSPSGPDEVSYGDLGQTAPPSIATNAPQGGGLGDEIEAKGVGYFFIAVPKAIAFYLAAVPLLAVNPFGFVRKGVEEQRMAAMGPMELIAYALPAQVFAAMFASWCALIGSLVGGGGFSFGLLVPIVPVIVAIVSSVIAGFLLHPVLGWIVRILKGSSDARSRTNYFLMVMTAYVLTQIPSGIGTLLALVNLPFLSILAPLLLLVSSLLTLLVFYKWLVYFNVLRVVQIIVLVLGALGAAGTGVSVVTATIDSVKRVLSGGGGSADSGAADEAAAKVAELQSKLAAIATDSSLSPEEQAKKAAELTSELAAAQEASRAAAEAAAAAAAEAAKQAAEDALKQADDAKADDAKADDKKADDKKADDKKADDKKADDKKADDKKADDKKADDKKADDKKAVPLNTTGKLPSAPSDYAYPEFKKRRDLMEDALTKDVTLLSRVNGTLEAYKRYHKVKHAIDQKYAAENSSNPDQQIVNERLAEQELYLRSYKEVQAFWRAIERFKP